MSRKNDSLYYRDLQRYGLLAGEEEQKLISRVKASDPEALKELITANLRFVVSVARHYMGRGLTMMELVNEGNLGLFRAAKKFEPKKEVKFISYAVWWIRQSIQQALYEQVCTVKIPPNKLALVHKFKKALEKNRGDYNQTIEMPEFKSQQNDIDNVITKISSISLDSPISSDNANEGQYTLLDVIGEEPTQNDEVERRELSDSIEKVLSNLSEREQKILKMYYGIGNSKEYTLEEIGKSLELTRERVRQLKTKALKKLIRNDSYSSKLRPFT